MPSSVTIRRGDTMSAIAQRNRVSLATIRAANPGINPRNLQVGQRLQLRHHHHDGFDAAPRPSARTGRQPAAPRRASTTRTTPGASNRATDRVPYRNGRIPSNALTDVGGGHQLYGHAARAFKDMRAAARRDGINIRLTDSYRPYADQVAVARRKGIYGVRQANGRLGLAARPGTSNHGLGSAVDVNLAASSGASAWLRANASRYGYRTIPREPWHWEYKPR